MLDLAYLRNALQSRYEVDKDAKTVEVTADTLDEALEDAAILLGISIKHLDYEIISKGSPGFLGLGMKEWTIKAYESPEHKRKSLVKEEETGGTSAEEMQVVQEKKDGDVFVHVSNDGVYLKVIPPVGDGNKASYKDAVFVLKERGITSYDEGQVKELVETAGGSYEKVGDFAYNPGNDALLSVDITDNDMKAWIYASPPGPGGADISSDVIFNMLRNYKIVEETIDRDAVLRFHDRPVYKENYLVAKGLEPQNGKDAYILYNFETDQTKIKLKESESGKVDFKELNKVQNVVEGQPLARKVPPEKGIPGKTVLGMYLEAKNGKDIGLPLGKNVKLAPDGLTILAETNGQVLLLNNKINVEPVLTIPGDVSLRTGNIMFLGTVIVAGNVEDGFSVKASGNIEVHGTVGKAEIDAEGDIIVNQGITGRNEAKIRAGRSLWSRFIENATVSAGELIIVSDGIMNSNVSSKKKILCKGKRAAIVGGHLSASEEIHAKTLGSAGGGSETVLEVGFDPEKKERLDILQAKKAEVEKELDEIELNLQTLINMKKQKKGLSEEKEESLKKLSERRSIIGLELEEITREIGVIQEYLNTIKNRGRVSASSKVYAGVVIVIRDTKEIVRNDCKATTFSLENGMVKYGKYDGPDDDMKKVPDGYTSN